jgi:hypothetical protein
MTEHTPQRHKSTSTTIDLIAEILAKYMVKSISAGVRYLDDAKDGDEAYGLYLVRGSSVMVSVFIDWDGAQVLQLIRANGDVLESATQRLLAHLVGRPADEDSARYIAAWIRSELGHEG